jgi:NitT/TauT family transport system substrate-binding protein
MDRTRTRLSRCQFMAGLSVVAAGAMLQVSCGRAPPAGPTDGAQPPETTTLRLVYSTSICQAPQYVADDLLRGEGFAEAQHLIEARS